MDLSELIGKFLLAVVLGFLMGLERDESWRKASKEDDGSKEASKKFSFILKSFPAKGLGGVRTYTLVSLLGGVAGLAIHEGLSYVAILLLAGLIMFVLVSYFLNYFDKNTFGLTTEISMILSFCLSLIMIATDIPVKFIIALAVLDAVILSMKTEFHNMISKFSGREIVDTLKFILLTLVILPFLPNASYGLQDLPYLGNFFVQNFSSDLLESLKFFNPFSMWLVVVFISGINFVGYFLNKMWGYRKGINIAAFFGGIVSSTAVTVSLASESKKVKNIYVKDILAEAAILTNLTSFLRVLLIAFVMNFTLGVKILFPMIIMTLVLLFFFFIGGKKKNDIPNDSLANVNLSSKSPLSIKPALSFAIVFIVVSFFTRIAIYYLGDSGFILSSLVSSVSGLDVVTINTAKLAGTSVSYEIAFFVLVIATVANLIVKMTFARMYSDEYFGSKIFKSFAVSIIFGLLATIAILLLL